jgi:hypothetical protein
MVVTLLLYASCPPLLVEHPHGGPRQVHDQGGDDLEPSTTLLRRANATESLAASVIGQRQAAAIDRHVYRRRRRAKRLGHRRVPHLAVGQEVVRSLALGARLEHLEDPARRFLHGGRRHPHEPAGTTPVPQLSSPELLASPITLRSRPCPANDGAEPEIPGKYRDAINAQGMPGAPLNPPLRSAPPAAGWGRGRKEFWRRGDFEKGGEEALPKLGSGLATMGSEQARLAPR